MDLLVIFGMGVRIVTVVLGLVALLCLAKIRGQRKNRWNKKMRDIWIAHFLGIYGIVQANLEHIYRQSPATTASVFFIFVIVWTIKGVRDGDMYVNETPVCVHPELHPEVRFEKE